MRPGTLVSALISDPLGDFIVHGKYDAVIRETTAHRAMRRRQMVFIEYTFGVSEGRSALVTATSLSMDVDTGDGILAAAGFDSPATD